jgi:hypothetical protein
MTRHRTVRSSLAALAAIAALVASPQALADSSTCTTDTDCVKGFICQVVGATACPAIACAPGSNCTLPPCTPQTISQCMPGPCNTDSDCATDMVCYADSYTSCPPVVGAPSCPPNADCAVPAVDAGACTTMTVKSCVPRYDLPCAVNSDCGPDFTCVPDTSTVCAGSGSAGSATVGSSSTGGGASASPPNMASPAEPAQPIDAGPVPPPSVDAGSPPTCMTITSSTSHCQANTITCTADADCPNTWTCVAPPTVANNVCVGPAILAEGGTSAPTPCESPAPGPSTCVPPYYSSVGTGYASPLGASNGSGGGVAPVAGRVPQGGTNDSSGSGAGSTSGSGHAESSGGCQLAAGGAGTASGSLFWMLGLAGLLRRRSR